MNRRWLCSDVWMDILPSFNHAQLGFKMALLSDRFDILVDKHFDGKTTELTIWIGIIIDKDEGGPKAKVFVVIDGNFVQFPMPERPLPNKIRFHCLYIDYIDHSVLAFLRSNKQIWDRMGTKFNFYIEHCDQSIWDVFVREIWPIFAQNIRHLYFLDGNHLDNLRRLISSTILTDLDQLHSINSGLLCPDGIADDGPNATAGQALSKWLHTPRKDGQAKELYRNNILGGPLNLEWVNNFKETFLRATTSVSYHIQLCFRMAPTLIEQFELMNEETNEKLTLIVTLEVSKKYNGSVYNWLLKRCPIMETAAVWENNRNLDNLNGVYFNLNGNCIGPLSPPDQSDEKMFSTPGPSNDQQKKE